MESLLYVLAAAVAMQFLFFVAGVGARIYRDSRSKLGRAFIDWIAVAGSVLFGITSLVFALPFWFRGYLFDPYVSFFVVFPSILFICHYLLAFRRKK